ncbi:hypothetical protein DPMN_026594 [Dreissena polymorpha]|uniref:Uncharacterized protein n=1 Tax=Dreissena polymorpha TaxID=45954 RepID=A0A9D4LVH8_DREPO|nr:hypothetical protein DPMN_026594 [Dreissena polymorpha]
MDKKYTERLSDYVKVGIMPYAESVTSVVRYSARYKATEGFVVSLTDMIAPYRDPLEYLPWEGPVRVIFGNIFRTLPELGSSPWAPSCKKGTTSTTSL